jgi:copper(I)-binding protein
MRFELLRKLARAAFVASALLFVTPSLANVLLETPTAPSDAPYQAVLVLSRGCNGSPTTRLRVKIPENVIEVRPVAKPGWTVTATSGPYARTIEYEGRKFSEGAREISWTGGPLASDQPAEFIFDAIVAGTSEPGTTLYFPTIQDCETGSVNWVETPAAGQGVPKLPAPALTVSAPGNAAPLLKTGTLVLANIRSREVPPAAKTAAGYLRITNEGAASDRLIGVETPIAELGQVHEMSNSNGIMKMRALERGLEIKPGESLLLKPGGYHIMFTGLKGAAKAGESFPATLTFEKAGKIAVNFKVEPLGAASRKTMDHQHMEQMK